MARRSRIEVCVDTVAGALAAVDGGADRIELCAALAVGGVTPGPGTLSEVRRRVELPLVVLVRPRRGDFLYDAADFSAARADVEAAKSAGADGVALGVLTSGADVDRERTARLIDVARPMDVTFHRAFDLGRDLDAGLEVLAELGVQRILTSGGAPDVVRGTAQLARLVERAGTRLSILAGGGVSEDNVAELVRATGVSEVHLSAGRTQASTMTYRREDVDLGASSLPSEYEIRATDPERIRAVARVLGAGP